MRRFLLKLAIPTLLLLLTVAWQVVIWKRLHERNAPLNFETVVREVKGTMLNPAVMVGYFLLTGAVLLGLLKGGKDPLSKGDWILWILVVAVSALGYFCLWLF